MKLPPTMAAEKIPKNNDEIEKNKIKIKNEKKKKINLGDKEGEEDDILL
jgi:hypothetical protein